VYVFKFCKYFTKFGQIAKTFFDITFSPYQYETDTVNILQPLTIFLPRFTSNPTLLNPVSIIRDKYVTRNETDTDSAALCLSSSPQTKVVKFKA